ncbi:MAG: GGDEF domain-containing protein [Kordiimonadaceae bacterium]|jgi:diguanylate cyclase (GGDEF)-like protein|nr:GGDEF domain-containing protein [Kordiimonadaceae bacterium]MBT6036150.1 GGDEF domain-containing protein [Kordiimonadaceae bacterium]MBT6329083.1 GGDEF domain-containing protein [Kordiimonadaceae bacterium]MBT7583000.1 GGDEF domain-containing protein [Kordiimonadaceae bacterium]
MKIQGTSNVSSAKPIRRKTIGKTRSASAVSSAAPARNINDTASVLGIPEAEMTPKVRNAIMTLMAEVENMRHEIEIAHRRISELEKLADQDSLIEISNRRAFVREMTRMISYSDRYGINSSLIFLDMNDLKIINDTYGHKAGDQALVHIAKTMIGGLRDSDIIGRLGGDEFGIILPKANEANADSKAQQILASLDENPLILNGKKVPLKIAYDIYPLHSGLSPDQALDHADKKMYSHKKSMKNKES